ncbi:MAG: hypothetical protein AAF483_27800 [Planctomycetota bacterium]
MNLPTTNESKNLKLATEKANRFMLPMAALGLAIGQESQTLYAACMDGVYSIDSKSKDYQKLYEHGSYASSVVYFPELNQIVSAGYDGILKWYDLESQSVIREIKAHSFWSWDLARAADSPVFASVSGQYLAGGYRYEPRPADEPCVKVYNAESGETVAEMEYLPPVQSVALNAAGDRIAAGNLMGDVGLWDASGKLLGSASSQDFTAFGHIKSHCQVGGIYAAAFDPRNDEVLVAGMGPMRDPMAGNGKQRWHRYLLDGETLKRSAASNDKQVGEGLMETLAFHPSGKFFVMAGRLRGGNWDVGFFDSNSGDLIHSLKRSRRITHAEFSADGSQVLLAEAGKQVKDANNEFGMLESYSIQFEGDA